MVKIKEKIHYCEVWHGRSPQNMDMNVFTKPTLKMGNLGKHKDRGLRET